MPRKPELRSGKRAQKPIRTTPTAATGDLDPILPASTVAFAIRLAVHLAGKLDPKTRDAVYADIDRQEGAHPFAPAPPDLFRLRDQETDHADQ